MAIVRGRIGDGTKSLGSAEVELRSISVGVCSLVGMSPRSNPKPIRRPAPPPKQFMTSIEVLGYLRLSSRLSAERSDPDQCFLAVLALE